MTTPQGESVTETRERDISQIIQQIRNCISNQSVDTILMNTKELASLCDAAEATEEFSDRLMDAEQFKVAADNSIYVLNREIQSIRAQLAEKETSRSLGWKAASNFSREVDDLKSSLSKVRGALAEAQTYILAFTNQLRSALMAAADDGQTVDGGKVYVDGITDVELRPDAGLKLSGAMDLLERIASLNQEAGNG